jgi:putative MATE family efflux protein
MRSTDMTQGSIWRHIVRFTIPLLIGNIFQQLYNAVDSIVVGNLVGKTALAAVGTSGPIINVIVGFFMGVGSGISVLLAQSFGAKDERRISLTVHTGIAVSLIISVFLTAAGAIASPWIAKLNGVPPDVLPEASTYLTVVFLGSVGFIMYNIGAAILQAVGDSRQPLLFLVVSTVINIALDLFFVAVLGWGVFGVALATSIAATTSAVLVVRVLMKAVESYRLIPRNIRIDGATAKEILRIGLPSGVQQALVSLSNLFVNGYINVLGTNTMAGYNAYARIDLLVGLPIQSLQIGAATFFGQNLGANKIKRAKSGINQTLAMMLGLTVITEAALLLFASPILRVFTPDADVIASGRRFINALIPFYLLMCFNQTYSGALRGAGDARSPMLIQIGCFVVVRQIYLFFGTRISNTIEVVSAGYPITWAIAAAALTAVYLRGRWETRWRDGGGLSMDPP